MSSSSSGDSSSQLQVVDTQPSPITSSSSSAAGGVTLVQDVAEDGVYFLGTYPTTFNAPSSSSSSSSSSALSDSTAFPPLVSSAKSTPATSTGSSSSSLSYAANKLKWASVAALNAGAGGGAASTSSSSTGESPADTRPLCTYFLAGTCRNGDRCRFKHAPKPDSATIAHFKAAITVLLKKGGGGGGGGGGGEAGKGVHGDETTTATNKKDTEGESTVSEKSESALQARNELLESAISLGLCSTLEQAEVALLAAEKLVSADVECGICLDVVLLSPSKRFGLLSNCSHAFCLDCIRGWRARIDLPTETVRACPVCRTVSHYVVACDRYVADSTRKAALLHLVSDAKKTIPCKHWNYGRGECPFGSSCFFAHLNPDGTPVVETGAHTFRVDADGNIKGGRSVYKLNQFLE